VRFSIIIPVYNVEHWLRQCLDSVLKQTNGNWEAVCVNDGSTDGSLSILEEYAKLDSRIRIISQANGGLSAARNKGLDEAVGDYILFLDSDDWIENNTLETIANHLQGEDMLCYGGRRYDEANSIFFPADKLPCATYDSGMEYYNSNALAQRDFAFVCVVLRCYRRQFLLDNLLRFREGILHEDNLFTPQACYYAQRVKVIDDILYNYRLRQGSIMTTRSLQSRKSMLLIANELASFFIQKEIINHNIVYRAITHHYQVALLTSSATEKHELGRLCNWKLYWIVCQTKKRHVFNYIKNRIFA